MKRILIICLLFITSSVAAIAQNTPPSEETQATFVAKYTSMYNHLNANQLNLAQQDFEAMKPMFISNFAVDKYHIVNAPNPTAQQSLMNVQMSKQTIYSEIMNLATNLMTNKEAIKTKFDEFAALY